MLSNNGPKCDLLLFYFVASHTEFDLTRFPIKQADDFDK